MINFISELNLISSATVFSGVTGAWEWNEKKLIENPNHNLTKISFMEYKIYISSRKTRVSICPDDYVPWDQVQDRNVLDERTGTKFRRTVPTWSEWDRDRNSLEFPVLSHALPWFWLKKSILQSKTLFEKIQLTLWKLLRKFSKRLHNSLIAVYWIMKKLWLVLDSKMQLPFGGLFWLIFSRSNDIWRHRIRPICIPEKRLCNHLRQFFRSLAFSNLIKIKV